NRTNTRFSHNSWKVHFSLKGIAMSIIKTTLTAAALSAIGG
ncbi:MAG: hypothetical protein ACI91Z_000476, partial [Yoonia sp.]